MPRATLSIPRGVEPFRRLRDVFTAAYARASDFTVPLVALMRLHDGSVECSIGTAIVVNSDGWLITAAHMIQPLVLHQQHQSDIAKYEADVQKILEGAGNDKGKEKKIRALGAGEKWIRNLSFWFGRDEWRVPQWELLGSADLALGRIDNFDPSTVASYPVFRDPVMIVPGCSVCRLGFPFHAVGATYDESTDVFTLDPGTLPIPRFPNEGIVTRFIDAGTDDGIAVKFLETSSAGLRGQSGGPIFDVDARICGMQVRTAHLPLGFSPEFQINAKTVVEHQFMNVGSGVHVETLLAYFGKHGVAVATA